MHRLTTAVSMSVLCATAAAAQRVTGVAVDSATGRPMPGVSILVEAVTDTSIHRGTMTDSAGRFSVQMLTGGEYLVSARRIGVRPLSAPAKNIAIAETRVLRFELTPVAIMLDTVRTQGTKTLRGFLYKLTAGQEWFAQHYRAGKGFFSSGAEILASRLNSCDYFGRIPGLMITSLTPLSGEHSLRCYDGQEYPSRFVVSKVRPSCLRAYIDRKLPLVALDSTELGTGNPLGRDDILPQKSWVSLDAIRGIEVFTNPADAPHDKSYPMPDDARHCTLVLVWTDRYWGSGR